MIVAILGESPADEAALRILVNAILRVETQTPPRIPRLEPRRGWQQILKLIPTALLHTYYATDAAGLAIVLDSNGSPVTRDRTGEKRESRIHEIGERLARTWQRITPRTDRPSLKTAIGLAAPAIEAWYLYDLDPRATEPAWTRDVKSGHKAPARIREYKMRLYGHLDPKLHAAVREARRLATRLEELEKAFPIGFGSFAQTIRSWRVDLDSG